MAAANDIIISALALNNNAGALGANTFTISATTSKVAYVFTARESVTITALGFRYGARTGTPPIYQISLQSVDTADANPSGTILGGGTPASATFTPPATTAWNGTWQWITLANSIAITAGTTYAIVIEYSSGTINASNCSSFSTSGFFASRWANPYALTNTASVWTVENAANMILLGYQSASRSYGRPLINQSTTSIGSNGNRSALKFNWPSTWWSTYQVAGIRVYIDTPATGLNVKFGIWDGSGVEQTSRTIDSDNLGFLSSAQRMVEAYFTSLVTLNAGTTYYAGVERVDGAVLVDWCSVTANGDWSAWPLGSGAVWSDWNGSVWTDIGTQRPMVDLILADITAPAAGLPPSGTFVRSIGTY